MQRPDWSALEIENATFEDLDPAAVTEAMVQMDMIDTIAMGIPKVFQMQRKRYHPQQQTACGDPCASCQRRSARRP